MCILAGVAGEVWGGGGLRKGDLRPSYADRNNNAVDLRERK